MENALIVVCLTRELSSKCDCNTHFIMNAFSFVRILFFLIYMYFFMELAISDITYCYYVLELFYKTRI